MAKKQIYAIAPERCEDYLTPGKAYSVLSQTDDGTGFHIKTDEGTETFCLWKGCAHLHHGDWLRSESVSA